MMLLADTQTSVDAFRSPSTDGSLGGAPMGVARRDVPVDIIRRAFHESGMSIRELARRLGDHHSGVGRTVSVQAGKFYKANADGEVTRYETRTLSVGRRRAERYLKAMGYDPKDWLQ